MLLIYKAVQWLDGKEMGGVVRYGAAIANNPEGPYEKQAGRIFQRDEAGQTWMLARILLFGLAPAMATSTLPSRAMLSERSPFAGGICVFESIDVWSGGSRAS